MLYHGDCLDVLKTLPDNSVDSLVTDPPAGIGFMGKEWDSHKGGRKEWCAWMEEVMREALRVLKPGAHGLVWAIPRTSHWTATALEDAGFEIRDCVTHLFGSGFPKSLDVSKAIDKAAGIDRALVPRVEVDGKIRSGECAKGWKNSSNNGLTSDKTAITDAAKQWQGWGTALKPAAEFWWLVRKPCSEKTVAANVLKWGTGALNIDAGRITLEASDPTVKALAGKTLNAKGKSNVVGTAYQEGMGKFSGEYFNQKGRFPANLVFSHTPYCTDEICDITCAVKGLNTQAGQEVSRFFYVPKISSSERNAGLEQLPKQRRASANHGKVAERHEVDDVSSRYLPNPSANTHPTVKPKKLMGYLIKLITPPNGTVLDPFMGSGSTGVAAKENGFRFVGVEKELEYFNISTARIKA